jgi:protein TonB
MRPRPNILDEPESLRNPFLGSVAFHAAMLGGMAFLSYEFAQQHETWGSAVPGGGGAVAISPVKSLPIPARKGPKNPVASDTESVVPAAPVKEVAKPKVKAPPPDAIPIKSRKESKPSTDDASNLRYRPKEPAKPNQVYSSQAPAAVSDLFQKAGSGAIGVDTQSVLGSRFGAYAALLMQRVGSKWQTNGLEGLRLPYAIVSVDLYRNGSIRNPKLVQTSGNYQLDTSAVRAITEAAPFPPLPPDYERDMVNVEFKFSLTQR